MTETFPAERYQILGPIGSGGMGAIYRARMFTVAGIEKVVALKLVRPELAEQAELARMFLEEARLALALSHANVVQSFDVGQLGDRYFITMEYVQGLDLHRLNQACRRSETGHVPRQHAMTIAVEALKGLDYAHRLRDADGRPVGLVHRDVSPSNILVSREGEVKVADFGLAHGLASRAGKIGHMAPEQIAGGAVDARTDVYAIASVLYELIAGGPRELGLTEAIIADNVLAGRFPRLAEVARDVPEELEKLVMRGLSVTPDDRPPSAGAMRQELERIARAEGLMLSTSDLADFIAELEDASSLPEADSKPSDPRLGSVLERVRSKGSLSVFETRITAVRDAPKATTRHGVRALWGVGLLLPLAVMAIAFSQRSRPPALLERARVSLPKPPVVTAEQSIAPIIPEAPPRAAASPPSRALVAVPRPSAAPGEDAELWVASDPWAWVYVDGQRVGRTTLSGYRVPPGSHSIRLENPASGAARSFQVTLRPGEKKQLSVDLGAP